MSNPVGTHETCGCGKYLLAGRPNPERFMANGSVHRRGAPCYADDTAVYDDRGVLLDEIERLTRELGQMTAQRNGLLELPHPFAQLTKERNRLRVALDEAEERSKACDQIADGEEGWQILRDLCVSTQSVAALRDECDRLTRENSWLRAYTGQSAKECVYCGLGAAEQAQCKSGFPGCARGDDQLLCREIGVGLERDSLRAALRQVWEDSEDRVLAPNLPYEEWEAQWIERAAEGKSAL